MVADLYSESFTAPPYEVTIRAVDGTRRFRYAYIEIARKNGKTDPNGNVKPLYPNNIEAYEALEEQYQRIFSTRKYSEYYSFRSSIMQKNKGL